MKFIYGTDGKLMPEEDWQLEVELARLEGELDSMATADRVALVERLRSEWAKTGVELTSEDNEVLALFCERTLDYRHVVGHFGQRLFSVVGPESE